MVSLTRVALVALGAAHGANAWGELGHAAVAYVAQKYVTPEAASWAKEVLGDTSSSYLANIASWADKYRLTDEGSWSAPLHYIDALDDPPTNCNLDYERDCTAEGCSISAIANYTERVADTKLAAADTTEALKFLVHFIGDLVQPLHDESYELGGNGINTTFQGYSDNLHSDWDTYIPDELVGGSSLEDAQGWADSLAKEIDSGDYKAQAASWIKGDTVDDVIATATRWAVDANALVCTVVMPDGPDAFAEMGDLYPEYYDSVIGTIEVQVAKGGYRLGNWINMIYKEKITHGEEKPGKGKGPGKEHPKPPHPGHGGDVLPHPRLPPRANLARAAMGGSCCSSERRGEHRH
ncbi:uncharacterized protein N7515_000251 [Penicillium bovifimosum]|uniref:Aspergillus nuclease S(1) n=1 Tax=Penicillium bovifimosum TaxID=126998 RepID=A0A9W9HF06_9EURO|nr:uncharacterized protein N7515_000251 [Penicillium bovifimosum]KAJ5145687.1 hypothetical protein N7515_000251 [Penicillium bovifimosum]